MYSRYKNLGQYYLQNGFKTQVNYCSARDCLAIVQSQIQSTGFVLSKRNLHLLSVACNYSVKTQTLLSLAKLSFENNSFQYLSQVMSTGDDQSTKLSRKFKPRERTFKTSYGQLAGLEWGNPKSPHKILAMHGWLDNSGTFEPLIPLLLEHENNADLYHVVAFDQPGVGRSSHFPLGALYTQYAVVVEMHRVLKQLEWDKFTLLSHSYGAHLSFLYSCVYPKNVESIVSLDIVYPITRRSDFWNEFIANSIEEYLKCEYHHKDDPTTNIQVPVYSEKDAIKRLMDGHSNSLTQKSAEILLKRGAQKQQWGYTFSRDLRLRHLSIEVYPDDDMMFNMLAGPFQSNLLIVRARQSPYKRSEEYRQKFYDLYQKNCPIFRDYIVDGSHHVHMNNPEVIAPEINRFLEDSRKRKEQNLEVSKSNL